MLLYAHQQKEKDVGQRGPAGGRVYGKDYDGRLKRHKDDEGGEEAGEKKKVGKMALGGYRGLDQGTETRSCVKLVKRVEDCRLQIAERRW